MTTGLTRTVHGNAAVGLAIGDGPSAVIAIASGSRLITNIRDSLDDLGQGGGA